MQEKKLKICIISIYFGELPEWFNIWLESVKYNSKIDFLFVTDQDIITNITNFRIIKTTFTKFKKLAQQKLNFKLKLNTPYKLCDYKEVWGIILEDEIKQYDFWGECDNDIILGDLYHFFDLYNLSQYDKFGNRGHLTVYRNTKEVNERYKLSGGWFGTWKEVFSSNRIWGFDETPGINAIYIKYNFPYMNKFVYADIDVNYQDIRLVEFDENSPKNFEKQLFYWQNGKLLRSYIENNCVLEDEFMYIHLQKRKMKKPDFDLPIGKEEKIIITNGKFVLKDGRITKESIESLNLKNNVQRFEKSFGGEYKKDLRFYWLGRRWLNIKYNTKRMLKKILMKNH